MNTHDTARLLALLEALEVSLRRIAAAAEGLASVADRVEYGGYLWTVPVPESEAFERIALSYEAAREANRVEVRRRGRAGIEIDLGGKE